MEEWDNIFRRGYVPIRQAQRKVESIYRVSRSPYRRTSLGIDLKDLKLSIKNYESYKRHQRGQRSFGGSESAMISLSERSLGEDSYPDFSRMSQDVCKSDIVQESKSTMQLPEPTKPSEECLATQKPLKRPEPAQIEPSLRVLRPRKPNISENAVQKPVQSKPIQSTPTQSNSTQSNSTHSTPTRLKSTQSKSTHSTSTRSKSTQSKSARSKSTHSTPTRSNSTQSKSTHSTPTQSKSTQEPSRVQKINLVFKTRSEQGIETLAPETYAREIQTLSVPQCTREVQVASLEDNIYPGYALIPISVVEGHPWLKLGSSVYKLCDTKACDTRVCDTKVCGTKVCDTKAYDTKVNSHRATLETNAYPQPSERFPEDSCCLSLLSSEELERQEICSPERFTQRESPTTPMNIVTPLKHAKRESSFVDLMHYELVSQSKASDLEEKNWTPNRRKSREIRSHSFMSSTRDTANFESAFANRREKLFCRDILPVDSRKSSTFGANLFPTFSSFKT